MLPLRAHTVGAGLSPRHTSAGSCHSAGRGGTTPACCALGKGPASGLTGPHTSTCTSRGSLLCCLMQLGCINWCEQTQEARQ